MLQSRGAALIASAIAISAGVLRLGLAFRQPDDASVREALYLAVDIGMLLTLVAFYASRRRGAGAVAAIAFSLALAGNLVIMGPEPGLLGQDNYALGADAVAIGWAALAVAMTRRAHGSLGMSAAFCASVVVGALAGSAPALFAAAGALFGLGLVLTGFALGRGMPKAC